MDLRDRSGILQIIFEEADCGSEYFAKADEVEKRICHRCGGQGGEPVRRGQ